MSCFPTSSRRHGTRAPAIALKRNTKTEAFNRRCVGSVAVSPIIFLVNAIIRYLRRPASNGSKALVFCGGQRIAITAAMSLTISSRRSNEIEILVLSGRLTLGDGTASLRETARKALDRGADILVDL